MAKKEQAQEVTTLAKATVSDGLEISRPANVTLPTPRGDFTAAMRALVDSPAVAAARAAGLSIIQRIDLGEGDHILGTKEPSTMGDVTDMATGEVRPVKLHHLRVADGVTAEIMGCWELDRQFDGQQDGAPIFLMRGPKVESRSGKQVNTWVVAKKLSK